MIRDPRSVAEQLGLDAREVEQRLGAIGLNGDSLVALSRHLPSLAPRLAEVIDRFYARIQTQPELARLLVDPELVRRLRISNEEYLRSLFAPTIGMDYVERRLQVGVAHHRIRLQPQWYVAGCAALVDDLIGALIESGHGPDALTLVDRVFFDVALALDAYGMRLERELRDAGAHLAVSGEPALAESAVVAVPRAAPSPLPRVGVMVETAEQRREFIGCDAAAMATLRSLAPLIEATIPQVLDDFYRFFSAHPQTARLVSKDVVARLQEQVAAYWRELVAGRFDRPYAASRMRVGMVHERIGLSPQWYLAGLARQARGVLVAILAGRPDAAECVRVLWRTLFFDVSFVIDAYMDSRAESVLRTEGYASRLIASLSAGVAVLDANQRVVSVNRTMVELLAVEPGLLQQMPVDAAIPVPQLQTLLRELSRRGDERLSAMGQLGGRALRLTAVRLDGPVDAGRIAVVIEDVTDLRRVASELDRDSLEMAALVDAVPDMLWAVELPAYTVLSMSRQALALTGRSELAYLGRSEPLLACIPEPDRGDLLRLVDTVQAGGHRGLEHRLVRSDGAVLWVHTTIRRVPRTDGRVVVACATRDVSQLRAERERRLATIGQVAGGVAHELNNALTVALGELQLMEDEALPRSADEGRSRAALACQRAARVTRNLLAFAQRQMLLPAELDVAALVRELHPRLVAAVGPRVEVSLLLPDAPALAFVDRQQLEEVLWQLVGNAREAMPQGGRLTLIVADSRDEFVTLAVVDDGVGMPPEVLARACDPFFSTRRGVAVGLGLSMAQGFLAQSGGSLVLDSAPGSGTTVTLRLPRRARGVSAADRTARPLRPSLLVVEDDPMVRGVVQRMAEHIGFGVVTAESAEAALAQLSRARPDAVLTDVMLGPGLDGVALARRIDAQYPGLPVLVTSGYAEGQFDLAALASRVPFLPKPFSGDQLRAALLALLAVVRR